MRDNRYNFCDIQSEITYHFSCSLLNDNKLKSLYDSSRSAGVKDNEYKAKYDKEIHILDRN